MAMFANITGEGFAQGLMDTDEMVVRVPPFDMKEKLLIRVGERPGATGEQGDALSDG